MPLNVMIQVMQFTFLKIFLLWLVLISSVLMFMFRGSEGGFSTLIIGTLAFALPFSIIITFVQKWIFEARLKASGTNELNDESSAKFAKFVGSVIILLIVSSFVSPLFILFGLYYVIGKVVEFSTNKDRLTNVPWYVGGALYSVLFYFVLPYFLLAILYVPLQMPDQPFVQNLRSFFDIFVVDTYLTFFVPVVFYEWYRVRRGTGLVFKASILWFIFVPTIARLILSFYSIFGAGSADSVGIGWYILSLPLSVLLGILVPSIWIFWRERKSFIVFFDQTAK